MFKNRIGDIRSTTRVDRCKRILVWCGCGLCGRRLKFKDELLFVYTAGKDLPQDVICAPCVRDNV